ncbi:CHD5-domain-containing protein [Stipitochalara longipes BDJ]|nr:CHD5-domain-containing protein [Stipitochalara longipes BDJ]
MPSLLLTVFLLQLAIHLVNTFGASSINTLLWNLYSSLPISKSESSAEQRELKSQYMKVRKELNATSSQDEFAKWAKLRRQHDKLLEQLEKNKASTDSTRATFDSAVSTLRWLGTNGLRMFLQFWYSKQAIFWIPKGWVPYYAEWLLSFPRAPLGSISIQAWFLACTAIIVLVSDALVAIVALVASLGSGTAQNAKKEPIAVPSEKAGTQEKKEL